jgi:hypothetical protein
MAVTLTPTGGAAVDPCSFTLEDVYRAKKTVSYPFLPATTTDEIIAVITALEVISEDKVCLVKFKGVEYSVAGGKANPTEGIFGAVSDIDSLKYTSDTNCGEDIVIYVPGPKKALFAGIELRLNDNNNADLVAFNIAIASHLVAKKTGNHDYTYQSGYRWTEKLDKPNVH